MLLALLHFREQSSRRLRSHLRLLDHNPSSFFNLLVLLLLKLPLLARLSVVLIQHLTGLLIHDLIRTPHDLIIEPRP